MQVIMMAVRSRNNFITKEREAGVSFSSAEDRLLLSREKEKHGIYIMGRKTYELHKPFMQFSPQHKRIVYTMTPDQYASSAIPGALEFTNTPPADLIKSFAQDGYPSALLLGGSQIYTLFLDARCISEMHITVEPYEFTFGVPMFSHIPEGTSFTEMRRDTMNTRGTEHITYSVQYTA